MINIDVGLVKSNKQKLRKRDLIVLTKTIHTTIEQTPGNKLSSQELYNNIKESETKNAIKDDKSH